MHISKKMEFLYVCLRYTHAYRTYSELLSAYSRRAPCVLLVADRTQRITGQPVFLLRAVRRACDKKTRTLHLRASHFLALFCTQTTRNSTHDRL